MVTAAPQELQPDRDPADRLASVEAAAATNLDMAELGRRIIQAAYLEGDFVLRSGRRSTYYFDKYLFATDPSILRDLGVALAARIPTDTNRVAGPELGAVALATVAALATGIPSVLVRKAAKDYGTGKRIEGVLRAGDRVILIEDVMTTGGQALDSAEALRDAGTEVTRVIAIVDREEGGAEALHTAGFDFEALFTLSGLGLAR